MPRVAAGVPASIVDTLARQLAALEIKRLQARVVWERWAPASQDIDAHIAALQEQLLAVSVDASAPRLAMRYVLETLDARQASLAVTHRQLLVTRKASSPAIGAITTEERLVEQRRAELRVSLSSTGDLGTRP